MYSSRISSCLCGGIIFLLIEEVFPKLNSFIEKNIIFFILIGILHFFAVDPVNIDYTKYMCDFLKKNNKKSKIVFTSSTQITSKSDYGKSKLICEKILIKHAKINNSKISIFRLPNVFGKWSKPNYNSVVSTFCNNIARNKKVFISDPKKILV